MSSSDQDRVSLTHGKLFEKKQRRKLHRACDFCRRRKAKCDGHEMPEKRCTNCLGASVDCTYYEAKERRPSAGYVESLETKLANMEKLFSLISPHVDLEKIPDFDLGVDRPPVQATKCYPELASIPTYPIFPRANSGLENESPDEDEYVTLANKNPSTMLDVRENLRFYGKSSGLFMVQSVLDVKKEMEGVTEESTGPAVVIANTRRPEFWEPPPWILPTLSPKDSGFRFPDPAMTSILIDLYFANVNNFYPVLHRPSFDKCLARSLHLRDDGFASVLLLVCAIGCRFSDDPQVTHHASRTVQMPTGWELFHQVRRLRQRFLPLSIHDMHVYCLAALFLDGSATPQAAWIVIGTGLRFVQEVGAHRRSMYGPKPTVTSELWKRAFWVLVVLDRLSGSSLGRPCALQDEDFDTDLPIECDDEYWTPADPEQAFKQPDGKPSSITFFVSLIKLNQIMAFALRTIYSIKKSKTVLGNGGQQWDQRIVAELDSAVNKWAGSVPDCLRWDPKRKDEQFFRQSVILYCHYYDLQIVIHRQYTSRKSSSLAFPSMAICANAARTCCHLVDFARSRMGHVMNHCMRPIFTSGIMLLLNLWTGQNIGRPIDHRVELDDVRKCQEILKDCETRWVHAGRLADILSALRNVGDVPFYRLRNGETQRDYLFMPNYQCFGMGPLPPQGSSGIREDQLVPMDAEPYKLDMEKILLDSQNITRLPFHLEQLFSNSQQDISLFPLDPPRPDESGSTTAKLNGGEPLVPVELLMYNDLIGCALLGCDSSGSACSTTSGSQYLQEPISGFATSLGNHAATNSNVGVDNSIWSSAPTRFDNWEGWNSYANLLSQTS